VKAFQGIIGMAAVICAQLAAGESVGFQWPKQTQVDLVSFVAVFDQAFPHVATNARNEPDPGLLVCDLGKEQQWQAAGLTQTGIDAINPAANMPEAAAGLTSKQVAIEIRSSAAGCKILQEPEYLSNILDTEKVFFSARHFQQPLHIHVRYETGTRKKPRPWRSDNTVIVKHIPTGINDYPWAVRTWHQLRWTDPFAVKMTGASLLFEDVTDQNAHRSLQLEQPYEKNGKLMSMSQIKLRWQDHGHQHVRTWGAFGLLFSYRDGQRHGLNYTGVDPSDSSVQYDCYESGAAQDYYRIIDDYDCVSVDASEFGHSDVFRSYALARAAARAEALAAMGIPAVGGDTAVAGVAEECVKAFTAARLCQRCEEKVWWQRL